MIINAENLILGRFATIAAKKALEGETVSVVNCEKAVIVGRKIEILKRYKARVNRGTPRKGPFFPKVPDRLVRRAIRGMLPWDKSRGREAFKRIMCYIDVPENFKSEKIETFDKINVYNTNNINFINIGEICENLKKNEWKA